MIPATNWCERPALCPTPTIYPDIPYTFNPVSLMCERTVPETLKIRLSGGSTTEPSTSLPFKAIVTDQNNQPADAQVTLNVDVVAYTGGHEHDADRPKGKLSTPGGATGAGGVLEFDFIAEQVAGTHTITAICDKCSNNPQTAKVEVKVQRLEQIPGSPFYTLQLPNRDTNHPNTHFLTKASSKKLEDIAMFYYLDTYLQSKQGVIPDFVLNDASLKWGGVLDCFLTCNTEEYPSTLWHKHHVEHRRGSVVDVKANGTPGSIVYEGKFKRIAREEGVDVGGKHGSGSSFHYHLRLNNNAKE